MKLLLIVLCVALVAAAPKAKSHSKRLSCQLGLCDSSCFVQGQTGGGCCGTSGPCYNICYCYGSGYEYRCGHCDL